MVQDVSQKVEEETERRIRDSRQNLTDIEMMLSESKASKDSADDDAKIHSPPAAAADEEIGND